MSAETMVAGRELDALLAERVMGWECVGGYVWSLDNAAYDFEDVPRYSTQIKWAWEVWEKLRERWLPSLIDCGGHGVRVELHSDSPGREDITVTAESAELAISLAALKAVGV